MAKMARSRFAQIGKYLFGGKSSERLQFLTGIVKSTLEAVKVQVPPYDLVKVGRDPDNAP